MAELVGLPTRYLIRYTEKSVAVRGTTTNLYTAGINRCLRDTNHLIYDTYVIVIAFFIIRYLPYLSIQITHII